MSAYTITSIAQGEEELTRSIGSLRGHFKAAREMSVTIDEVLGEFDSINISLSQVAVGDQWSRVDNWYKRAFFLTLYRAGVRRDDTTREISHNHNRNNTIASLVDILKTSMGKSQPDLKLTRYKTDEELEAGVTPNDRDSFRALMELLVDLSEIRTAIENAHHDYDQIAKKYAKIISDTNSKWAVGAYGTFKTSRRTVTGWVEAGRGKTFHVRPDPWTELFLLPSEYRMDGGQAELKERAGWIGVSRILKSGDIAPMPDTERFTSGDALTVKLWLTPKLGAERRRRVGLLDVRAQVAFRMAQSVMKPILDFKANGGPAAVRRKDAIDRVLRSHGTWRAPDAISAMSVSPMKVFAEAALAKMNEDELNDIYEEIIKQTLTTVGGPLSEDELKMLTDIPADWEQANLDNSVMKQFGEIKGELYEV